MDEYFLKIQHMKEDVLFEEMKKLNQKLYAINQTSPMFQQITDMLAMCKERHKDLILEYKEKNDKTPEILEIGEIESEVYTPEYSEQELLTSLTNFIVCGISTAKIKNKSKRYAMK
jgi:hypothetical protein